MRDAVVGRTVTNHTQHNAIIPQFIASHCCSSGNSIRAADNGVGTQMAHVKVGDVHAPASPAAVAFFFAEQLSQSAIEVLLKSHLP